MERYIIFNGTQHFTMMCECIEDARILAVDYCDCSKPIIVKKLTEIKQL